MSITVPTIAVTTDATALSQSVAQAFKTLVNQLNTATTSLDAGGMRVVNVGMPTSLYDAVNKLYLQQQTTNTTFTGSGNNNNLNPFAIGTRESYAVVTFYGPQVNNSREAEIGLLSIDETDIKATAFGTIGSSTATVAMVTSNFSRYGKRLSTVAVTSAGHGYHNNSEVTFSDGTGFGVGKLITNNTGGIAGVKIVATGFGFQSNPTSTFAIPGTGGTLAPVAAIFCPGDYILWNDVTAYEINRINNMVSSNTFIFDSTVSGTATVRSTYFNSFGGSHTGIDFYLATPYTIRGGLKANSNDKYEAIHANKCVLAAWTPGTNTNNSVNLSHASDVVPAPGLRTMNGAAYMLGIGTTTMTVGQTADLSCPVQSWESLRFVYGILEIPGTNTGSGTGAAVAVTVLYKYPTSGSSTSTDTVCTLSFPSGINLSYNPTAGNFPDGQNMPVIVGGNGSWPPNLFGTTQMKPDGWFDLSVTAVGGTTAGGKLLVVIQT